MACKVLTCSTRAIPQVLRQHVAWLAEPEGPQRSAADHLKSLGGVLSILVWGARHGHGSLCEQTAQYLSKDAGAGPHLFKLAEAQVRARPRHFRPAAISIQTCVQNLERRGLPLCPEQDAEGNTTLHACVLANQVCYSHDTLGFSVVRSHSLAAIPTGVHLLTGLPGASLPGRVACASTY